MGTDKWQTCIVHFGFSAFGLRVKTLWGKSHFLVPQLITGYGCKFSPMFCLFQVVIQSVKLKENQHLFALLSNPQVPKV